MFSSSTSKQSEGSVRSRSASQSSIETVTQPAIGSPFILVSPTSNSFSIQSTPSLNDSIAELGQQNTVLASHLIASLRKLKITHNNTIIQIAKIDADIRAQEAAAKAHFVHRDTASFKVDLEMMKSLLIVKGSLEMLLVALEGVETFSVEEVKGMSGSELAVQLAKVTERVKIVVALEEKLKEGGGRKKSGEGKKGVEGSKNRESVWDWKPNEWE